VQHFVAIIGIWVMGYHAGLAGSGRSVAINAIVLALSAVMTLIGELDRSQEGLLGVSQQAMIDLRRTVGTARRQMSRISADGAS
jgi:hypothetical protein